MRGANGDITAFDAPGAGTGAFQGTSANAINEAGTISGFYRDAANEVHGFVRAASGAILTFDAPGAGYGAYQGTYGLAINALGEVVGECAGR